MVYSGYLPGNSGEASSQRVMNNDFGMDKLFVQSFDRAITSDPVILSDP